MPTIIPDQKTRRAGTFINHSQPDPEDRINPELFEWFANYCDASKLSAAAIGRQLGYADGTQVSRYLSDKFAGNLEKFEARLHELRHTVDNLRHVESEVLVTKVTREVDFFADLLKHTGRGIAGVLHGPAGIGKTTALRRYASRNPLTVYLCTNAAKANGQGMRSLFWSALPDKRGYALNENRYDYLIKKFAGSGRLFIVDNAQRLDREGRDFVFDFMDDTNCPILLGGNPSILNSVAKIDQQHSRTFLQREARLDPEEVPKIAAAIIEKHLPGCVAVLSSYAVQIAEHEGHLRSLDNTAAAAAAFISLGKIKSPREAFLSAHTHSTRDYKLI